MMQHKTRLPFLDVLRGIALVAMAIYHFGWDLAFFNYVAPELVNEGAWKYFARSIASSFLILVGIGLILAHSNGIGWQGFWRRWAKVAGAALIITIATYFATPDAFIFFGILHHIAFASLAGLLFLRLPWPALIILGAVWIGAAPYLRLDALSGLHMAWTGLANETVRSNDYVPVFPWFGVVLIGMGIGAFLFQREQLFTNPFAQFSHTWLGRLLAYIGRHSLIFYLIHQPILIALIYLFSLVMPAQIDPARLSADFQSNCQQTCMMQYGEARCTFYCGCVEADLAAVDLFTPLMNGTIKFTEEEPLAISQACSLDMLAIPQEDDTNDNG
ncbi:heparan-alpha-glucosaminide N-acetyltransferase [Ahrensia kielensis]|uniref:Heparan-alpha-glucosaminide N-acetyltransferase n=1 Tax=Ahrensia kielensis TaxID=76980 RepID=A0ABU9T3G6_9HYPH